jgi:hypothetical protein
MKKHLIATAVVALLASPAQADGLDLTKGKLVHTAGGWTKQVVSIKNNTKKAFDFIAIECGFFHNDTLIAANSININNVDLGQTAYGEVMSLESESSRADCRISGVKEHQE